MWKLDRAFSAVVWAQRFTPVLLSAAYLVMFTMVLSPFLVLLARPEIEKVGAIFGVSMLGVILLLASAEVDEHRVVLRFFVYPFIRRMKLCSVSPAAALALAGVTAWSDGGARYRSLGRMSSDLRRELRQVVAGRLLELGIRGEDLEILELYREHPGSVADLAPLLALDWADRSAVARATRSVFSSGAGSYPGVVFRSSEASGFALTLAAAPSRVRSTVCSIIAGDVSAGVTGGYSEDFVAGLIDLDVYQLEMLEKLASSWSSGPGELVELARSL